MLTTLIQEIKDIQAAIGSKNFEVAARKLIAVQQQVVDTLFGPQAMQAASPDQHAALKAACDECVAACHTTQAGEAGEVGKLGDGKILALIQKVLPLIIALLG